MSQRLSESAEIRTVPQDEWGPMLEQVLDSQSPSPPRCVNDDQEATSSVGQGLPCRAAPAVPVGQALPYDFPIHEAIRRTLLNTWLPSANAQHDLMLAASRDAAHLGGERRGVSPTCAVQPVGLVVARRQAGATAVVWPPLVVPGEPDETASRLISAAAAELQQSGVCLAQALIESETAAEVAPFLTAGFVRTSELLYLVSHAISYPQSPPITELEFEHYSADQRSRLAQLVERTYEGTLDCPELDGVRNCHDVLAGYQATGVFDASRWLIARHKGQDVGCLLLTDHPAAGHWELMYLGLIQECRGRGWGLDLVRHAQWLARSAGAAKLVLAVDALNAPAIACYAAAGFTAWDRRAVYLKIFSREQGV